MVWFGRNAATQECSNDAMYTRGQNSLFYVLHGRVN